MASNPFVAGDLVVSISGDGDGSGTYTDNQATPITLEDISTSGQVNGTLVLPQTASTNAAGTAESPISGEYGSSSEGTLELATNGQSLVIAGYGVNAQTYNANGAPVYGNAALAQSTSVPGGTYTAVPRVIADINYSGVVDTSTAVYNVENGNNPRSVATNDGTSFYLSGQGQKGDTTQGVFYVKDGASSGTAVNTSTDTRTAELYNGNLYVSTDSKQGPTANITVYSGEPTIGATPTVLPGISNTVTLNGSNGNSVNGSSGSVHLSPENFFFASQTVLYVADSGNPKQGGLGDGGLQKWSLNNGTWNLDYTLSAGLNLMPNTTTDPGQGGQGTTGLIGLTGKVNANGSVSLYATNSTVGDLNQTYLYGITDQLSTTAAPTNESFTTLATAAPDTNIRGVAFAPVACYARGTLILTSQGQLAVEDLAVGDLVVTASGVLRQIKWIGTRAYSARFARNNPDVVPVRFEAGAIAPGVPARDLVVSPKHAMVLDGALVPAECLLNGRSVTRLKVTSEVSYWHVELDSHDVLIAEGAESESYVEDGNRMMFHNASASAFSSADGAPARYCLPRVEDGFALQAIRAGLARRADVLCAEPEIGFAC